MRAYTEEPNPKNKAAITMPTCGKMVTLKLRKNHSRFELLRAKSKIFGLLGFLVWGLYSLECLGQLGAYFQLGVLRLAPTTTGKTIREKMLVDPISRIL